ncbi:hypothetical protein J2853_006485 [Streptosporangium lutulentum]|uniref:Uncharacterized protein n=1 Tax=Streptosporangium lutulentum TaxID=1461250 RepID=A0ABT9QKM5_9ACTN|nr:hypothetical protein [Streptosporangium lutulentum]
MNARGEGARKHSTVSVMGPTEGAMTERGEGTKRHSTVSVTGPTKEAP